MAQTNYNQIIGRNVQLLRNRTGLTQDALAEYLGVSRDLVRYYEAGTWAIQTVQIQKLADLFGVNQHDLYAEDPDQVQVNLSFAVRADQISPEDLHHIAHFLKIIRNYLNMKNQLTQE